MKKLSKILRWWQIQQNLKKKHLIRVKINRKWTRQKQKSRREIYSKESKGAFRAKGIQGNMWKDCTEEASGIFCYTCAEEDVIKPKCPVCKSKNWSMKK